MTTRTYDPDKCTITMTDKYGMKHNLSKAADFRFGWKEAPKSIPPRRIESVVMSAYVTQQARARILNNTCVGCRGVFGHLNWLFEPRPKQRGFRLTYHPCVFSCAKLTDAKDNACSKDIAHEGPCSFEGIK